MGINEIHYTDFSFQKLCEKNYGINRGLYNTIDCWFYEKGVDDIQLRRKEILRFLGFVANSFGSFPSSKVKFGSGGLKVRLNQFWDQKPLTFEKVYETSSNK
jgi:riboflavin kinase